MLGLLGCMGVWMKYLISHKSYQSHYPSLPGPVQQEITSHPIWNFFLLPLVQTGDVVAPACTNFQRTSRNRPAGAGTRKLPRPFLSICTIVFQICTNKLGLIRCKDLWDMGINMIYLLLIPFTSRIPLIPVRHCVGGCLNTLLKATLKLLMFL
jgi:hypothetical protein